MNINSYPTELGQALVGLGAEQPWPRGFSRLDQVAVLDDREIWSACDAEDSARSVLTFANHPSDEALADLKCLAERLAELAEVEGVVRVVEADTRRGFLVLEPIVGVVSDAPALRLKLGRKLELFQALCGAVAALHERSWVVRRLSPDNVGLDPKLAPRLLDVGELSGGASISRVYAAPEVISGAEGDARSDVFSLGRMLAFLLLTSDPPIEAESVPRLDCLSQSPAGLSRIVRRATCVEPLLRYPTVAALMADVERYGQFEDVGMIVPNAVEDNFSGLSSPPVSAKRSPPTSARQPPSLAPPPTLVSRELAEPTQRRKFGFAAALAALALLVPLGILTKPLQTVSRWYAHHALSTAGADDRGAAVRQLVALGERDFARADFKGANLTDLALNFAELQGANLNEARLDRAELAGANLAGANVQGATAIGSDWSGANVAETLGLATVRCDETTTPPEGFECSNGFFSPQKEAR